jgi:hypothetical protein
MIFEYENRVLRVENAEGLRWQLADADKPPFAFNYDALYMSKERVLRRVGSHVHPLTEGEISQVINSVMTQLEYDGLLDVMITGREGSSDLYAEEARRVLSYIDSLWNAFYGLAAQIKNTQKVELQTVKEYADMMPFPPAIDYFSSGLHPGLFDAARNNR